MSTINETDKNLFSVSRKLVIRVVYLSLVRNGVELFTSQINKFISDDDVRAIIAASEVYFEADHTIQFYTLVGWITRQTYDMIFLHGDNGINNDRPADMNRFSYWYQHLSLDLIVAEVDNIRSFKPCVEVLKTDKAISCDVCKKRVCKNGVVVYTCPRFPVFYSHSMHSDSWKKDKEEKRCCSKSECINKLEFPMTCRRDAVVNSAPDDERAIDVASEVKAVQRSLPKFAPRGGFMNVKD